MAINISVNRANTLVKDEQGFVYGVISNIEVLGKETPTSDGEYKIIDALEFTLEAKGTIEPINLKFMTGSSLNSEPKEYKSVTIPGKKGRKVKEPIYNNFTTLCLNCNILTIEELEKLPELNTDEMAKISQKVEGLVNNKVKFLMTSKEVRDKRTGKPKTIPVIDIQTVVLDIEANDSSKASDATIEE